MKIWCYDDRGKRSGVLPVQGCSAKELVVARVTNFVLFDIDRVVMDMELLQCDN